MADKKLFVDLDSLVDYGSSECLNEQKENNYKNVFVKSEEEKNVGKFLRSDADAQLLLNIHFQQAVKIHSIKIDSPEDGSGPKTLRLFVNKVSMGFTEAEDDTPVQELVLTPQNLKKDANPTPLKFVKFQNVNSISIFVQDNQGNADNTVIDKLHLIGQTLQGMKLSELKPVGDKPSVDDH
jgi:hypothetical protein